MFRTRAIGTAQPVQIVTIWARLRGSEKNRMDFLNSPHVVVADDQGNSLRESELRRSSNASEDSKIGMSCRGSPAFVILTKAMVARKGATQQRQLHLLNETPKSI